MSYLKAHIFIPFHCFVQVFLSRKYSAVSTLVLGYITLLCIANELPLCSQCLFITICLQCCFQRKKKSSFKMIVKKKGGLRIKLGKTIHRKIGLNLAPRKISEQTGISRSSIRRMIKRRNFRQFKKIKPPKMNDGCCNRGYARAIPFAEKFECNTRMIEKTVWQDEKDFTLDVPVNLKNERVYGKGEKSDVPHENLFASSNKMSRKVMVSAAISWCGPTKPFFVNENGIKVNKDNYCKI